MQTQESWHCRGEAPCFLFNIQVDASSAPFVPCHFIPLFPPMSQLSFLTLCCAVPLCALCRAASFVPFVMPSPFAPFVVPPPLCPSSCRPPLHPLSRRLPLCPSSCRLSSRPLSRCLLHALCHAVSLHALCCAISFAPFVTPSPSHPSSHPLCPSLPPCPAHTALRSPPFIRVPSLLLRSCGLNARLVRNTEASS